MQTTYSAPRAQNFVITLDTSFDYEIGRCRDRDYFYWPHGGHNVRIGLAGEYRGALVAKGYALPPKWPVLPRCIVVSRDTGKRIERVLIPDDRYADELADLYEAYQDEFAFYRAKQLAERDPYVLVDIIDVRGRR